MYIILQSLTANKEKLLKSSDKHSSHHGYKPQRKWQSLNGLRMRGSLRRTQSWHQAERYMTRFDNSGQQTSVCRLMMLHGRS